MQYLAAVADQKVVSDPAVQGVRARQAHEANPLQGSYRQMDVHRSHSGRRGQLQILPSM